MQLRFLKVETVLNYHGSYQISSKELTSDIMPSIAPGHATLSLESKYVTRRDSQRIINVIIVYAQTKNLWMEWLMKWKK